MKIEVHHRICDLLGVCPGDVVSVIGAGGKHTLMYHIALELYSVDIPVVLTSTTNLHRSAEYARLTTVRSETGGIWEKDLDAALADGGRAVLVDAKLTPSMYRGVDPETVARISTVVPGAVVLVKSDGARKRLLKAPANVANLRISQWDSATATMGSLRWKKYARCFSPRLVVLAKYRRS